MKLKKFIAGVGIVLLTVLGGASVSQAANAAPASFSTQDIKPGDGDTGVWP
ncbi:hypothetical protein ACQBAU_12815 [Propionibacteriaceae bacterium Y2011]|uniref:hypothetical protein n=1 Tax=Microlunatus sp. Y2014 TaxID=3418488 RepID=UPI003B443574